jgi:hypothetical protein
LPKRALYPVLVLLCLFALPSWAAAQAPPSTGGAAYAPEPPPPPPAAPGLYTGPTVPGDKAVLQPDGTAAAPLNAPPQVQQAVWAANTLQQHPYKYGGGHGDFEDSGYDCSGAVSYALHGAGLLDKPLDSTGFMSWGESGEGEWITVYGKSSHAYIVIAGARFDTSGEGEEGPRWRKEDASTSGYAVRHPEGL